MAPATTRDALPIIAVSASAVAIVAAAYIIHSKKDRSVSTTPGTGTGDGDGDTETNIAVAAVNIHSAPRKEDIGVSNDIQSESDGILHIHREIDILPSPSRAQAQYSSIMNIEVHQGDKCDATVNSIDHPACERVLSRGTITIAYCSTTGTCAGFATRLHSELLIHTTAASSASSTYRVVQLIKVSEVDWWDELINNEDEGVGGGDDDNKHETLLAHHHHSLGPPILLFILPTWTNGTLPPDSDTLLHSLHEISTDWRVAPEPLRTSDPYCQLKVGAFGMGSSAYDASTVGKPAKDVFAILVGKLGARPLVMARNNKNIIAGGAGASSSFARENGGKKSKSLMIGDSEVGDAEVTFDKWMNGIVSSVFVLSDGSSVGTGTNTFVSNVRKGSSIRSKANTAVKKENQQCDGDGNNESGCACKSSDNAEPSTGCCSSTKNAEEMNADEDNSMTDSLSDDDEDEEEDDDDDDDNDDSEGDDDDVLDVEDMGDIIKKQSTAQKSNKEPQEMVTPHQAKALKKEGYKLIGTHSAVKLCRWTKHQLRGRGGCYKHTHYGITSYQCMEATPSLACANKCVFCWRHHKNPVGREWRWKMDDPKMIVEEAVKEHISMIKETRGIPGIQMDRWTEAHTVRHCALSLVGEPIMYPKINELLHELHERKISTFLVTNGQHPQAINDLIPITQLYVSVDASTPESLEAIDRPLFRDAWDRLKSSLSCLKNKGQRTVARLTVVKGWNSDEIGGYARLLALGHCSLVEVKGVTFCGKSDASNLNMSNTPWHHEVVEFSKLLLEEINAVRAIDPSMPEYDLACEHKHSCSVLLARVDQFAVPDPDDPSKRKWRTWIDYDKFQLLAKKHAEDPTNFKFGVEDYIADTPDWAVFGADEEGFDPTDNRHRKKNKYPKYTNYDEEGIPTHDTFNEPLSLDEISTLRNLMHEKKKRMGDGTTVTELHGGEKVIDDASLMFRGLVVTR